MRCVSCGHENPETYHFCGECGAGLQHAVPEPALVASSSRESGAHSHESPVLLSGPSLLGLSNDPDADSVSYLLDDEPPPRRSRTLIVLPLLIIIGAIGFLFYRNFYVVGPFSEPAFPPPRVPAFAYDHTPPEVFAHAALAASLNQNVLPSRKLVDNLALENISAEMRNQSAQEKLAAERKQAAPSRADQLFVAGENYLHGRGVARNCSAAIQNLQAAAKENNASAMADLGSLYASGHCVKFNRVTAYEWFAKAKNADPDNHWLDASMDMLWRNMSQKERSAILD